LSSERQQKKQFLSVISMATFPPVSESEREQENPGESQLISAITISCDATQRNTLRSACGIDALIVLQEQTLPPVTPDVGGRRSAPAVYGGVSAEELKLDLGSSPPRSPCYTTPGTSQTTSDDDNDDNNDDHPQQPATAMTGPLRAHVASMAKRFVEEGRAIRRSVLEHLHRFSICCLSLYLMTSLGQKHLSI